MSAAQKRVEIAKDVIKQIKEEQFKISCGVWCERETPKELPNLDNGFDQMMMLYGIQIEPPKCTVCAIGAAYVSSIRLFNKGAVHESAEKNNAKGQLDEFFDIEQQTLIENAFEKGDGGYQSEAGELSNDNPSFEVKLDRAIAFGRKHKKAQDRAIAIFANIIRNKGEFKP